MLWGFISFGVGAVEHSGEDYSSNSVGMVERDDVGGDAFCVVVETR